jgi:hypothetical protein
MANMRTTTKKSEREIDQVVIKEADNEVAWEKPIRVRRAKSAAVSIPAEIASRAAFFARLHRERSVEDWIKQIVMERIDSEEAAFAQLKRELRTGNGNRVSAK